MRDPGDVLRIANCSGFYGDRLSAAREMVEGGPIDVLTGDYLAELTLMILHRDRQADPSFGYAKTFPLQLRGIAATCLERGIKIVVNAGGLNPAGCAEACRAVYRQLGLEARVAHIEGDDLLPRLEALQAAGEPFTHLDRGMPLSRLEAPVLSANAYLGGWGIAKALELGADLVICPRVTDASLVVGPAAWRFGWARDDWNRLAAAVAAGHILECGPQATGGNYAFFLGVEGLQCPGFPIAEIAEDGSFTVTKHPGTGGEVSVGTVTAQLLYEIAAPRYENPDVTAHFDTLRLTQSAPDRVHVSGVEDSGIKGEPPPPTTKVCLNYPGGFKNSITFLLTGLDLEDKARLAEKTMWAHLGGREQFAETHVSLHRAAENAESIDGSFSFLTVSAKDPDRKKVGRRFSSAAVEMALANYPGFNLTAPPGKESPFGVYWPALVSSQAIEHQVVFEGQTIEIPHTPGEVPEPLPAPLAEPAHYPDTATEMAPLGRVCGARSGDKGGNANLGVWTETDAAFEWLSGFLTSDRLHELIPEARDLSIDRYPLPNLRALNFVLRGFLGDGVAASLATDAQAKGLGEFLRSRRVEIPSALLND
ncbi:MAG: acyclic terpene utilization AtuA family protein [Acidobacteriota bacterium]